MGHPLRLERAIYNVCRRDGRSNRSLYRVCCVTRVPGGELFSVQCEQCQSRRVGDAVCMYGYGSLRSLESRNALHCERERLRHVDPTRAERDRAMVSTEEFQALKAKVEELELGRMLRDQGELEEAGALLRFTYSCKR